ncbi:MAG TPA: hypothetical protein VN776_11615, partial [Terracidiphilus sp.]|nr:hypothetical protein [Terracidiphilus sp.]
MRQSAQQVELEPSWKQEVNRRVAEHRRKAASGLGQQGNPQPQHTAGGRAALAAARVAARYAKAPTYSEMLADEARAAVRAAEAASRAALEAQAVAESVLAGLEARATQTWEPNLFPVPDPESAPEPARGSNPNRPHGAQAPSAAPQGFTVSNRPHGAQAPSAAPQGFAVFNRPHGAQAPSAAPQVPQAPSAPPQVAFEIRWDTDLPAREPSPVPRAFRPNPSFEPPAQDAWDLSPHVPSQLETEGFELVEPAQPIHANLIEFPRELVATRKVRPRRAEGPLAAASEVLGQLSIFEVDPGSISIDVSAPAAASTVTGPRWSGIELDEEPELEEFAAPAPAPAAEQAQPVAAAAAAPAAQALELAHAPLNRRLLAALVDFSLISAAFLAAAFAALANVKALPPVKEIEFGSAVALALIVILYQAVFFTLARAT